MTKNKNLTTLFGALMALALLAAACGGSDDASAADQEVIDAVATQLRAEGDVPPEVDVDCMASAMVTGLGGADVMADSYGLTAESITNGQEPDEVELSVDAARSLADNTMACGMDEVMASEMTGDGMSEDDASCLVDKLDDDAMRDLFAAEFMSDADADRIGEAAEEALFGGIFDAISDCDIDPNALGL